MYTCKTSTLSVRLYITPIRNLYQTWFDLKVCDDGKLVQILRSWTLSIFYLKFPVYISKPNVSETGFYLRPQVKPTQLGPIDRASPHLRTPVSLPRWHILNRTTF
jgi:hypothetical protein